MNLTNVWQWIVKDKVTYSNYKELLLSLIYNEPSFILYSSNKGLRPGELPTHRTMCRTIKDYIYCNGINENEDDLIKHDSHLLDMKEVPVVISTVSLTQPVFPNKDSFISQISLFKPQNLLLSDAQFASHHKSIDYGVGK